MVILVPHLHLVDVPSAHEGVIGFGFFESGYAHPSIVEQSLRLYGSVEHQELGDLIPESRFS
ncbi:MAG: hypothetical protein AB4426_23940 [Xenococcaceae cyanobacterium]